MKRLLAIAFLLMLACGSTTPRTQAVSPVIRYEIEESGVEAVSITLENDTEGTDQGDFTVPFRRTYHDFESGDFVYISAQIIRPTEGAGYIICKIYQGSVVIAEARASGFPSIATCSGSVK